MTDIVETTGQSQSLATKVALVTGAAGGIGAHTASVLAAAGARVVLTDLEGTPLHDIAEGLEQQGFDVASREADLTSEASVADLIAYSVDHFGGLDIVDNNAAATMLAAEDLDVTSMSVETWDQTMAANLRGPMLICKYALPVIVDRGGGSIINISSGLGLTGDYTRVAYSCSKAAVVALTRHIATAYGDRGVRCNAIAPGLVETSAAKSQIPEPMREIFVEQSPIQRLGAPNDIAQAVLFLASDASAFITGQIICVDGGLISHTPTAVPVRRLLAQLVSNS